MLIEPSITEAANADCGLPMTIRNCNAMNCIIMKGTNRARVFRYSRVSGVSAESAPKARTNSSAKMTPKAVINSALKGSDEHYLMNAEFASASFFFPRSVATYALPPVANMKPMAPKMLNAGIVMFNAARASEPTQLETKSPSTIECEVMYTIMTIDDKANRRIFPGPIMVPSSLSSDDI